MFNIRDQLLQTISRTVFVDRVTKFLVEELPDAGEMDRGELRKEIDRQIKKAESYGLNTERSAANYVVTAWLLGPEFDTEFEAAEDVLPSSELSAEEKADWLETWTIAIFEALESE